MSLKIAFVNMPFAALQRPSIALTELKAVTDAAFGDRVQTSIHYLNQDFGRDYGIERYQHVVQSIDAHNGGFGDWFFRQEAFPDAPDNSREYFSRYYVEPTREHELMREFVATERPRLGAYLDSLVDRHDLHRAAIVGFTTMFAQNVASFALARRIKARNPDALIVFGGANCEASMGREIADHVDVVDFVFSGPALRTFPELVRLTIDGDLEARHRIDGVLSAKNRTKAASGCGTVQLAGLARPSMPEVGPVGAELPIDTEVPLDYDGFMADLERNFPGGVIEPALLFETSRGCWWGERAHCTFCGLNSDSMGYRAMSPERALALIRSFFKHAPRLRRLECVDNIMPKSYVRDVFANLDTPESVTIFYEIKADLSDADLATLSRARVRSLQPGIESLATSTLKLMKKGTSGLGNVRFLKDCLRNDVYPEWNLLVGFPGEDEAVYEMYERTLPLLAHLPPPSGVYPVRFDRFSPYHTHAGDYGLKLEPYDFYSLVYPFDAGSLANLAYYFVDRNFGAEYATRTARWIGRLRAKVDAWRLQWHGAGRTVMPRLFLKETAGGRHVYDSRGGEAVEYPLAADAERVLERLETAAAPDQIAAATGLDRARVDAALAWLDERRLVMREGEKYVGLAFRTEPQLMECQRPAAAHAEAPALVARPRDQRRLRRPALAAGQAEPR